jgi:hypothetical protein
MNVGDVFQDGGSFIEVFFNKKLTKDKTDDFGAFDCLKDLFPVRCVIVVRVIRKKYLGL